MAFLYCPNFHKRYECMHIYVCKHEYTQLIHVKSLSSRARARRYCMAGSANG